MTDQQLQPVRATILPNEMSGVMFISGYRGLGKSFLASQADLPQNIVFLDFENKGSGVDAQLNFGMYRALTQEAGGTTELGGDPLLLYEITSSTILNLEQDRYTTLIFDNVSPLELALNAEATRNAEKYATRYGLNYKNIMAGRFGGAKAIVNKMIGDMTSIIHSKGIRLVIATSHVSSRWSAGGPIPNKYNIKGADRWQELSILTLILIPGDRPPIPSALVQKEQLGTIQISREPTPDQLEAMRRGEIGHEVVRRLPPKISQCTFQTIRRYLNKPANFSQLDSTEKPTFEESDPFDQKLNKEQFAFIRDAIAIQEREERREEEAAQLFAQAEQQKSIDEFMAAMNGYSGPLNPMGIVNHLKSLGKECDIPTAVSIMQQIEIAKTNTPPGY